MAPAIGYGSAVGLGEETTWGTPVSRTNWLRPTSVSLNREVEYAERNNLGTRGDAGRVRRSRYVSSDMSRGDLEWEFAYDDSSLLLLKHAMGNVATAGAGTPYTHTFTLGDLPTGLTIEKIIGSGGTDVSEVFAGVKIASWSWSCEVGGQASMSTTLIGKTSATRASAGTPTYHTGTEGLVLHHQAGTLSFNSVDYTVRSINVQVDNGISERQNFGSKNTSEPLPSGFRSVRMTVTLEYAADTPYAAYLAQTQGDVVVAFTGAGNNSLTWTLHNAEIDSDDGPAVSDVGVLTHTLEFVGLSDGTDLGLKCVITNANATATAN